MQRPETSSRATSNPQAATSEAAPAGIHGTHYVNPDPNHGVGDAPRPTDVPQTYSNSLSATIRSSPDSPTPTS